MENTAEAGNGRKGLFVPHRRRNTTPVWSPTAPERCGGSHCPPAKHLNFQQPAEPVTHILTPQACILQTIPSHVHVAAVVQLHAQLELILDAVCLAALSFLGLNYFCYDAWTEHGVRTGMHEARTPRCMDRKDGAFTKRLLSFCSFLGTSGRSFPKVSHLHQKCAIAFGVVLQNIFFYEYLEVPIVDVT